MQLYSGKRHEPLLSSYCRWQRNANFHVFTKFSHWPTVNTPASTRRSNYK